MVRKIKTISVDEKFFEKMFEPKRLELQKKLGLINLSQPNFTKMIKNIEFKISDDPKLNKTNKVGVRKNRKMFLI